ncbi:MAG: HK97 gp10 family phage protein [Acetobacter sp.]|uniref:HK97 gp10 family phage protein n=1 Tax=Acetobacter sp. TaxID=440 RepID=UPI003F93F610
MADDASIDIRMPSYVLEYDRTILRKNLQIAGREVAAAARRNIRNSVGSGRLYYGPGGSIGYRGNANPGPYRASAPGQAPVSVTGTLARSIKAKLHRDKVTDIETVKDAAFYAKFLETGAQGGSPGQRNQRSRGKTYVSGGRVLKPRKFLSAALEECAPDIRRRLADAAIQGVVMERVKK